MATTNCSDKVSEKLKLNPRRYFWIVLGFYLFSSYIKATHAENRKTNLNSLTPTEDSKNTEEGGEHQGVQIFQVDWANVSDIAVITLWIFCAMLAKIGTSVEKAVNTSFNLE